VGGWAGRGAGGDAPEGVRATQQSVSRAGKDRVGEVLPILVVARLLPFATPTTFTAPAPSAPSAEPTAPTDPADPIGCADSVGWLGRTLALAQSPSEGVLEGIRAVQQASSVGGGRACGKHLSQANESGQVHGKEGSQSNKVHSHSQTSTASSPSSMVGFEDELDEQVGH
jgi:hypothetical protein